MNTQAKPRHNETLFHGHVLWYSASQAMALVRPEPLEGTCADLIVHVPPLLEVEGIELDLLPGHDVFYVVKDGHAIFYLGEK